MGQSKMNGTYIEESSQQTSEDDDDDEETESDEDEYTETQTVNESSFDEDEDSDAVAAKYLNANNDDDEDDDDVIDGDMETKIATQASVMTEVTNASISPSVSDAESEDQEDEDGNDNLNEAEPIIDEQNDDAKDKENELTATQSIESMDDDTKEQSIDFSAMNQEIESEQEVKPKKIDTLNHKSPKMPKLNQSKSTDADHEIEKKNIKSPKQSIDIDSFSSDKMSDAQRTSILNEKKKKSPKRKQSTTLTLYIRNNLNAASTSDNIITSIGGNQTLSMRQRAMIAFQNKKSNESKWKKQTAPKPPIKAQKSSKLLERIAKLKNHSNNEQEWRAKLEEKRNKNTPKPSPTHSRQGTNDIVTESIIKKQKSKKNKKDTIKIKGAMHKKQTSASQQVIIQKLRQSADAWKKKQQKDGDATLQSLKTKKKILSKQERQRKADEYSKKMQIENNAWKQKREKNKIDWKQYK